MIPLPLEPTFLALVLATFVSEDLTCLAAGLLLAAGRLDAGTAVGGCVVGIVLGDAGVWLLGRLAAPRLSPGWAAAWLVRHGGPVAFASRFLPGTRVPLLLAAGGSPRYLLWAVVAGVVCPPVVVLSVALFGAAVPPWAVLVGLGGAWLGWTLRTRIGRAKAVARVSRLWRWEFWPAWVFYLPLVPWFLLLAVRYRSLTVWTAANPAIPAGGVVGESKAAILANLPPEVVVPTTLLPAGDHGERLRRFRDAGLAFPVVLKPDAGERGAGVKRAADLVAVEKYLLATPGPVIVQPYHPGPFEAGVFYYRLPGEEKGRVFSGTDKVFPVVAGDGRATLEELIWRHPRYCMQAKTFLARHDGTRVLPDGEALPLALAGNHCQGTLFRDGSRLLTPELEAAFDAVARRFAGFFVGRFDVRYADPAEFRAGRGFAVVELNGVTSESTNLYDPTWPLWRAYRTLFRQWALLFRIGHANRVRGYEPATLRDLLTLIRSRDRTASPLSD